MRVATADPTSIFVVQLWQVTLLLLLAWLATRLLRRHPQIGYLVCLVLILKCLLPPFWSSPTSVFSWVQAEQTATQSPAAVELEDRYVFRPMAIDTRLDESAAPSSSEDVSSIAAPNGSALPGAFGSAIDEPRAPEPSRAVSARQALLSLWMAGVSLFLLIWVVQAIRFWVRLRHHARPCADSEVLSIVQQSSSRLGIRRRVRVLEGDDCFQTCSFGIIRPAILLPSWLLREFSSEGRQQVITHELIHVRRGDSAHAVLQNLAQAVWWFHPLVWWLNRRMIDLRERCCDHEVLTRLACTPAGYAECLLQVLKGHRAHQSFRMGLTRIPTMAGTRRFEETRERIEEIMNDNPKAFHRMRPRHWAIAGFLAAVVWPGAALIMPTQAEQRPAERDPASKPKLMEPIADSLLTLDEIDSPSFLDVSADGRFAYMASWNSGTLNVFERDGATGKLKLIQTLKSDEKVSLEGAVHIRLSPNNQFAAVSCLHAKSLILFDREAATGKLSFRSSLRGDDVKQDDIPVLSWAADACWSPDNKFIYVADAHSPGNNDDSQGRIVVLQVVDQSLKLVQILEAKDQCFANVRGLQVHPDGVTLFAVSSTAGTLVAMDRNPIDGKLAIRQIVDRAAVGELRGAMQLACSTDGQFVYTVSGRFENGNGICVFKLGSDGKLKLVQALSNSAGQLPKFEGGNRIVISPNGAVVYATGTNSNQIIGLQRDARSGKLTLFQQVDSSQVPDSPQGPCGLAFSPDGKNLYVTWEFSKAVSAFGHPDQKSVVDAPAALPKKHATPADAERATAVIILRYHQAEVVGRLVGPHVLGLDRFDVDGVTNTIIVSGRKELIDEAKKEIEQFEVLAREKHDRAAKERDIKAMESKNAKSAELKLLELDIEEARLLLASAERDFKLVHEAHMQGAITASELETKRLSFEKAKIAVKRAELKLEQAMAESR